MTHILCLDLETTGIDPLNDRVIQANLTLMDGLGFVQQSATWLINPGIDIPAESTKVHGFTTRDLQERGGDPRLALEQIRAIIQSECVDRGPVVPLVIYNASFDTTFLNAELERHEMTPLFYAGAEAIQVIDPMVLDRQIYEKRKGKGGRKLVNVAPIYGVPVEANAHDAAADNLMSGRIALKQLEILQMQGYSIATLKTYQPVWYEAQMASLEKWLRRSDPNERTNREWPIRTQPQEAAA